MVHLMFHPSILPLLPIKDLALMLSHSLAIPSPAYSKLIEMSATISPSVVKHMGRSVTNSRISGANVSSSSTIYYPTNQQVRLRGSTKCAKESFAQEPSSASGTSLRRGYVWTSSEN
jgi:hypothetical protein